MAQWKLVPTTITMYHVWAGSQEGVGCVGGGSVRDGLCQEVPIRCRFEIEIEPIFGILALYDVREKKKVGSSFFPFLPQPSSLLQGSGLPGGGGPAAFRVPRSQKTSTLT